MLYGLSLRMIGGILGAVAVAAFIALAFHWKSTMTARGETLATICNATRTAAEQPKMKCADVVVQINALGQTVANVRAAAAKAQADDAANLARVKGEQGQISEESANEYEARVAAARAAADKLRAQLAAEAHSGRGSGSSVSGIPSTASVVAQTAEQDRFSLADRLTATEQAIQLDELIRWVKKQAGVDVSGPNSPQPAQQPR